MEITGRHLASQQIAIHPLGDPEIHADPGLAGGVRHSGAVDVLLAEQAAAARSGLDLMGVVAPDLGHLGHLEPLFDGVFGQLARLLDRDDLHRARPVLIRRHIDKRHPQAARGDAVAIEQPGMQREIQFRRRRQHDAHVHVALHRHRLSQLALGNHHLAHKAVQQPPELRQVGVGAQLLGDPIGLRLRHHPVEVAQILDRKPHHADAVEDPFVERKTLVRVRHDLSVPLVRQAALQLGIDIIRLDRVEHHSRHGSSPRD